MANTEQRLRAYVLSVCVAALAATSVMAAQSAIGDARDWTAALFFCAFGLLAHMLGYQTARGRAGTIGFLAYLSIGALSPNLAALASVFIAVAVGELVARRQLLKGAFNVAQHMLAISLAVLAYQAAGGVSFFDGRPAVGPFMLMFLVFFAVNKLVVAEVLSIANKTSLRREIFVAVRGSIGNDVLALPLVLLFAFAYVRLGPFWSGTLALPLIGVRQLYKSVFELERINQELLQLMVAAIEARDPYTSGHSQRVARYSRVIARLVGLGARQVDEVGTAALLHDVGKIHEEFAPILRKPGRLTEEEFAIMQTHSEKGAQLVAKVTHFSALVPLVRSHHEMWNGRGYPGRLAGDEIPLGARIIAIADTIDAMTTVRPYRPPRTLAEVRAEIECASGSQFDPRICVAVLAEENWQELGLEIEIAAREFPAEAGAFLVAPVEVPRHSSQFRVT